MKPERILMESDVAVVSQLQEQTPWQSETGQDEEIPSASRDGATVKKTSAET